MFHRDIKPENILVANDRLKLADFGSCRGIYSKQVNDARVSLLVIELHPWFVFVVACCGFGVVIVYIYVCVCVCACVCVCVFACVVAVCVHACMLTILLYACAALIIQYCIACLAAIHGIHLHALVPRAGVFVD